MPYRMYLDGLLMPITPAKVTTKIANQNETATLINGEQINQLKAPGLTGVSFELLLPQVSYPFAVGVTLPPRVYLARFEQLKTGCTPFQWILSRCRPGLLLPDFYSNLTVSLEDYEIIDDAEEGFDLKVKIELKQYRDYGTRRVTVTQGADGTATATLSAPSRPAASAPKKDHYTTQEGDSLWNIAKQLLGDGARYAELYRLNRELISNPTALAAGLVLSLPVERG